MNRFAIIAACLLVLAGCKNNQGNGSDTVTPKTETVDYSKVTIPEFSADSAYGYVERQLSFGNRIPGSKGWERCAAWLTAQMGRFCDTVIVQDFRAVLWDGSAVPGRNIIGLLNPQAEHRIIVAAHWDSRSWADHDPAESNHRSPVPGANDGASGVATLMEMARVMKTMPPSVGVDFIFFDVEDQGAPEWASSHDENNWCLGSQYWASHRHTPYANYAYGILFDMVGTHHPRFTQEGISRYFAPGLTDNLWAAAKSLGHSNIFINESTPEILDDHYFINTIAHIPMVDIVQNDGDKSFFEHWHTVNDDMNSINKETLRIVADVTMKTLYADFPNEK